MNLIEFERTYSYDDIANSMIHLFKTFTPLISLESIGISHDKRDIIMLKLGFGKKNLICSAGVHGRETINPVVLLRIIEEYARSYYGYKSINGIDLRKLLNEYSIIFVPLLNPDGYMIALHGFNTIRDLNLRRACINKNISYNEWKYNGRAIDINRNFPSISFQSTKEMPYSSSENETKALIYLFNQYESLAYLDFHSRGESIFYFRRFLNKDYNNKQLLIAKKLQNLCGYELEEVEEEIPVNDSGGNTVHYFSEIFKNPAITIETVKDEENFPLNINLREEVFMHIATIPITLLTMI